jgi:hypothetical protein
VKDTHLKISEFGHDGGHDLVGFGGLHALGEHRFDVVAADLGVDEGKRKRRRARERSLQQMLLTTRFASKSSKTSERQASVLGSTLERSQRPRQEMPHCASDRKSSGSSSTDTPRRVSAAATSARLLQ